MIKKSTYHDPARGRTTEAHAGNLTAHYN
uniref:Uncharacterized protein n=1 Tax=Arundo donax TaxID=35708 RepID=A0A0A8ZJ14_ARUDO